MTQELQNIILQKLANLIHISLDKVTAVVALLQDGATVPFIARYRKEMSGGLDEVEITAIKDGFDKLLELENRRTFIIKTISEQNKLTPELLKLLNNTDVLTELEDLYLPYKPKRRTKATIAREKGLEPLAQEIWKQEPIDLILLAKNFIDTEKAVNNTEEALQGARDIMAEWINENAEARARLRLLFAKQATVNAKVIKTKEKESIKYQQYFNWSEPLKDIPSHRFLAIMRGTNEEFLRMSIEPDETKAIEILENLFVKTNNECAKQVILAVNDSYSRLICASLENEIKNETKIKADKDAIEVFSANLKELLMAAPLGQVPTLAIDPGFRTGCKVVCLNSTGQLLYNNVAYLHDNSSVKRYEAIQLIEQLVNTYNIQAIAIGNGTAGRETFDIVKKIGLNNNIKIVLVNESGASIYSASDVAREEFPEFDLTVRGAISIGRRLCDPLAELVKIDPKSIGVGQYQHDVDQAELKKSLDALVLSCVNKVGVEINTASKQLLTYVSGLSNKMAQNIIDYRNQNGTFKSKNELQKVNGIGPKTFEQAAGFIRIYGAQNPLDAGAVHPESYYIVEKMAADLNCNVNHLVANQQLRQNIDLQKYITPKVGLPTLTDILAELEKPGRDPRSTFEESSFAEGINTIEDLSEGMILPGIVTNVTNFGAFIDIGVHQSGLVHISHIANKFVNDPKKVLKVNQKVMVKILKIDIETAKIQLSIKDAPQQ